MEIQLGTHKVKGWFVETIENGNAVVVPYNSVTNQFEFSEEERCDLFLKELRDKNPGQFRKVQREIIYTFDQFNEDESRPTEAN